MCLILLINSLLVTRLISESVSFMFYKVHWLFILVRQAFECCWLEDSTATKLFIPRVITHYTHFKFLFKSMTRHKLSLTEAMLFETEKSISLELSLWYFLETINVLDVDCLDWSSLHRWLVIVGWFVSRETIAAQTTVLLCYLILALMRNVYRSLDASLKKSIIQSNL